MTPPPATIASRFSATLSTHTDDFKRIRNIFSDLKFFWVFWNSDGQAGLVRANVDHTTDYDGMIHDIADFEPDGIGEKTVCEMGGWIHPLEFCIFVLLPLV